MAHSDASTRAADVPKRKREVSEEERVKVQARRDVSQTRRRPRLRPPPAADAQLNVVLRLIEQAKEKVENTIKQAHDELKESRAQQAEAKLQVQWNQLQLEQSRLTKISLIAEAAARDLKMQGVLPARTLYLSETAGAKP